MFLGEGFFMLFLIVAILVVAWGVRRPARGNLPPGAVDEMRRLREAVNDLTERVARVEEEREFDRKLLESIGKRNLPPGEEKGES